MIDWGNDKRDRKLTCSRRVVLVCYDDIHPGNFYKIIPTLEKKFPNAIIDVDSKIPNQCLTNPSAILEISSISEIKKIEECLRSIFKTKVLDKKRKKQYYI